MGKKNLELALILALKDQASGGASRVLSRISTEAKQAGSAVDTVGQRFNAAADGAANLRRAAGGIGDLSGPESLSRTLRQVVLNANAAKRSLHGVSKVISSAHGFGQRIGEVGVAAYASYRAGKATMDVPVGAFADLEQATADLKISMMDAAGNVPDAFAKISKEAEVLGNKLPGTTKDYMMAARALIEQGTPANVVANGGLRASSYLGALLDMDRYEAATTVAKMREAYGLKDEELPQMADLMQRARYAFGIHPSDFKAAAAYAAPDYNTIGLTGLDKAKQLLAIQGMAATVGLESSSFGTNFAMMLKRTSQIDSRLGRKSREAREVKAMLDEHGISMQFYDAKGQFAGISNMLQQLAKLRGLSQLDQSKVLHRMFGVEASRPAQILVQKGYESWQDAMKRMDNQADIDTRINTKMDTFAAKLEALGGTVTNVMAQMGKPVGEAMKGKMDRLTGFLGDTVQPWLASHPRSSSALTIGAGVGTAGATFFGTRAVVGGIFRGMASGVPAGSAAQEAAVLRAARLGRVSPWLKGAGVAGLALTGVEAYDVATDDRLSGRSKAVELSGLAGGAVGAIAGAKLLGALGTAIMPGVGTAIGALLGGGIGYFGGAYLSRYLAGAALSPGQDRLDRLATDNGQMQRFPTLDDRLALGNGLMRELTMPQPQGRPTFDRLALGNGLMGELGMPREAGQVELKQAADALNRVAERPIVINLTSAVNLDGRQIATVVNEVSSRDASRH
ncbi:phage tail tape measure protein [Ralstonia solanacearum]|uniref:Phage tail tape measure protein n=1 Tax=Ralstonia solanacearum TaxID=305 RepID=A0AAW5ZPH7_RALSL|nr:phage tail tape measure protein [Ralstonia solanacearum]MDB0571448.1 phage tail tape measure protein [Ralstonia solanacearum]